MRRAFSKSDVFSYTRGWIRFIYPWIYLIVAIGLWLYPFFIVGWRTLDYRWVPRLITFQYSAAALFTRDVKNWWDHHVEVTMTDGRRVEVDERSIFPMGAFGHRSRLDRIANEVSRRRHSQAVLRRLAEHASSKLLENEIGAKIIEVHIVRTVWPVGDEELRNPLSGWNPPPSHTLPKSKHRTLMSYSVQNGNSTHVISDTERHQEVNDSPSQRKIHAQPERRRILRLKGE